MINSRHGGASRGIAALPVRPGRRHILLQGLVLLALILLLLAASVARASSPGMKLHEKPRALPEMVFVDANFEAARFEQWRGKFVLLNIWATWCGPCREEMPTLDDLQAKLGGDRFDVVALSIDKAGLEVVQRFYEEIEIKNLKIYLDPGMVSVNKLDVFGLPSTLLIGPDGLELARLVGPASWNSPEMIAFFEATMAQYAGQ